MRILKEDGCNKVICTKCYAVLCDYCGKDITKQMYNHFDGQGRAPPGVNTDDKTGKCPLYDESHKRKDQQVDKAEKEAMAKVRAEHPDLSEDDLRIKFVKGVQSSSNRHHGDHQHHVHAFVGDLPPHHAQYRRHQNQNFAIREAAMAALVNRENVAAPALNAMFEGAGNMLDGLGGIAPHAVQLAREQGPQARDHMRAAHLHPHLHPHQHLHHQAHEQQQQYQRHAAFLRHQQVAAIKQEVLREELQRRLQQARRTGGLDQAAQTHRAHMTTVDDPIFPPPLYEPQAADFRARQNDQPFGNNTRAPNPGISDDGRARRQPDEVRRRVLEERSNDLGGVLDLDPPTQRREINDLRRRTAEFNAERNAERVAESRPYDVNSIFDPPLRMPGEYPRAPRRRNPMTPGSFNPWVAGANDQTFL